MLKKWCEITSFNGVIDLYEARESKNKFVFWAIVMVLMTIASVWFTYRTILGYIETPTVTNVATIYMTSMKLPEMMVCYDGGFDVSAMEAAKFSEELIHRFNLCMFTQQCSNTSMVHDELKAHMQNNNVTMSQLLDQFGYDCDEVVVSADLCNSSRSIFGPYGQKCHVFKHHFNQTYPGKKGGIVMQLVDPANSYFNTYPVVAVNAHMFGSFSITMEQYITNETTVKSVQIPLNVNAEIILKASRFSRTTSSTAACYSGVVKGTSNACFLVCYNNQMAQMCNCTTTKSWIHGIHYDMCDPFTLHACKINVTKLNKCAEGCLPLCDEWLFESSVTYKSIDSSYLAQPSSFVVIFYDAMQYTRIQEVAAFTMDMAIANVGGQSGLWLGASVVTVIQALYYIILSIVNCMYNGKRSTTVIKEKRSRNVPRLPAPPPNLY